MTPSDFPQKTIVLQRPPSMTDEECSPLAVCQLDDGACLSRWVPSWRERLALLFGAPLWLWVVSGRTQPPVALEICRNVFVAPPSRGEEETK